MHKPDQQAIRILINGKTLGAPAGCTVAVALAIADEACRTSVQQQERGPLCAMGICYECRVTVNGVPHRLACQTICASGMEIQTNG